MRHNPRPQELYRHFKGNIYQILCLAKHSETGEPMVVYQAMYDTFQIYVRPLAMFMEEVDFMKYPDAAQRYRFEFVDMEQQSLSQTAGQEEMPVQVEADPAVETWTEYSAAEHTDEEENSRTQPQAAEPDEQLNIDPLVMKYLEADTYEQRLNILAALRHRITDDMINTMAMAVDLAIKEGDVEERYEELRSCLLTFEKYECNRLR